MKHDPHDELDDLANALFDAARHERADEDERARAKLNVQVSRSRAATRSYAWPAFGAALALAAVVFVAVAWRLPERVFHVTITPDAIEEAFDREPRTLERSESPERAKAAALQAPRPQPTSARSASRAAERSTSKRDPLRPAATLAEEIALLDQARAALAANDGARVIALVDRYERELAGTRMRAEAALLRIEALAQSGQRAQAAQLAQRFVQEHAGSPLADRARTLLNIENPSEGDR